MKNSMMKNLLFSILLLCPAGNLVFAEVSVIVNPSNASSLSDDDIKKIFLGKKKTFDDGSSILAVNLSSANPARAAFDEAALGKSASQIKAYWSKLVFSGKGEPPKEFSSDEEILKLVKENPAVIGYVDSAKVDASVKVVGKY